VIVTSPDGVVLAANRVLLGWVGVDERDVVGHSTLERLPEELREVMPSERRSILGGSIRARILPIERQDTSTFPALLLPSRLLDSAGTPFAIVSLVIDLGKNRGQDTHYGGLRQLPRP
jgi:PAS domain S-box-containing protein